MTVLLDAFALIAYFRDEPAAAHVQRVLWNGELAMSAIQVAEVVDRMERVHGVSADDIEVAISALGIFVHPVDHVLGAEAGRIRSRHYLGTGRSLSLADSICVATAAALRAVIATADPVLIAVATAESLEVLTLPASG